MRPRGPALSESGARVEGFTLLEVIISLMILVLGVVAILPLYAVASQSHKRGIDQTHASLIAPRIAAHIQENLIDAKPKAIVGGVYVEYGQTYRYDASFTPISAGRAQDPLADAAFILQVTVKWKAAGGDHTERFETVVLRKIPR